MQKRRKEDGFTLIELMIVIAVIGILAVVLIPKVGTVKTQAKAAGIDTNVRMVQGYVQSRIGYWNDKSKTNVEVAADVKSAFTSSEEQMKNPFVNGTGGTTIANLLANPADTLAATDALEINSNHVATGKGSVEVLITTNYTTDGIVINGLDQNGNVYSTVTIKP